jgi:IS30 family transposase
VAIWADLVADKVEDRVCVETIYAAVFAGVLEVKPTECLRSRRPRRKRRRDRHQSIRPGLPNITSRPAAIGDRSELGHWEGDQVRHEALFDRAVMKGHRRQVVAAA